MILKEGWNERERARRVMYVVEQVRCVSVVVRVVERPEIELQPKASRTRHPQAQAQARNADKIANAAVQ